MGGSSRLPCVFFLSLCFLFLVFLVAMAWWRRPDGEKKKKKGKRETLITYFLTLCTIFTVFGNKDNSILDVFNWFFTCGTCGTHEVCGQIISCHIHGVRTLFHTMGTEFASFLTQLKTTLVNYVKKKIWHHDRL